MTIIQTSPASSEKDENNILPLFPAASAASESTPKYIEVASASFVDRTSNDHLSQSAREEGTVVTHHASKSNSSYGRVANDEHSEESVEERGKKSDITVGASRSDALGFMRELFFLSRSLTIDRRYALCMFICQYLEKV